MEEALAPLLAESAGRESAALARLTAAEWAGLERRSRFGESGEADLLRGRRLLDCALRIGEVHAWQASFAGIVVAQRSDGGFSAQNDLGSDRLTSARCGELLLRASVALSDARLAAAARHTTEFLTASEADEAGDASSAARARATGAPNAPIAGWPATAVEDGAAVLRLLGVARALAPVRGAEPLHARLARSIERTRRSASRALLAAQLADGSWADDRPGASRLGITARALVALAGEVLRGDATAGAASGRALAHLAAAQEVTGAFGGVAQSVDCLRAALLAARVLERSFSRELDRLAERRDLRFLERGFAWLLAAKSEHGWGDVPGGEATFERTCDGVAMLVEIAAYRSGDAVALARLWGYAA